MPVARGRENQGFFGVREDCIDYSGNKENRVYRALRVRIQLKFGFALVGKRSVV